MDDEAPVPISEFLGIGRQIRKSQECWEIRWIFGFGRRKSRHQQPANQSGQSRRANPRPTQSLWRTDQLPSKEIYIRQMLCLWNRKRDLELPIVGRDWVVLKRERLDGNDPDVLAFTDWMARNYPGVKIPSPTDPDFERFHHVGIASGAFLIVFEILVLGTITRYHLSDGALAAWLIVWMYIGPIQRWTLWGNPVTLFRSYVSPFKWVMAALNMFLLNCMTYVVLIGLVVLTFNLFGVICGVSVSFSIGLWFVWCVVVIFVLGISAFLILFFTDILGMFLDFSRILN
jgi:hypothetical protein